MKTVACIIARTNSVRLSKKVLRELNGITMIEYIIRKVKRAKGIDKIYICTSYDPADKILLDIAKRNQVEAYAGHPESVIERLCTVAQTEKADAIVRITGDNIFTDEVYLELMLRYHQRNRMDYTRTEYLPLGMTAEILGRQAILKCRKEMPEEFSQYLMIYIFHPLMFKCQVLVPPRPHRHPEWSFSVDTPEDFERVRHIIGTDREVLDYEQIRRRYHPRVSATFKEGVVKLPGEILLSFDAYRKEMDIRIKKAKNIAITLNQYKKVLNEQRKHDHR